jgi:hypothetical protein
MRHVDDEDKKEFVDLGGPETGPPNFDKGLEVANLSTPDLCSKIVPSDI